MGPQRVGSTERLSQTLPKDRFKSLFELCVKELSLYFYPVVFTILARTLTFPTVHSGHSLNVLEIMPHGLEKQSRSIFKHRL